MLNIEYINKIHKNIFFIIFMFYYFYFFYFCSHWNGMMLITKLLQNISDQSPVNPVFFYSLHCDDVCVAWWKRGKVWWCNTLWGWMLHTLFLSLLLLKRSVCLLFHLVLLWCLHFILVSIDKVETEHYRFLTKCCFVFLGWLCNACLIRKPPLWGQASQ